MKESILKKRVFIFLLAAKFLVIAFILFHWEAGGFSKPEALAAITMMLPVFTAYTTVMFKEIVRTRHVDAAKPETDEKRIGSTFKWLTYTLFPLYALVLVWAIGLKPKGDLGFDEMSGWVAAIESGLGVYIGQIVFALFKKEEAAG